MNYKNRDDELIRKQKEAQNKYRQSISVKQNTSNRNVYSKQALEKLAAGGYKNRVPELKKTQNTVSQNNVPKTSAPTVSNNQVKPSTRYQNQNITKSVEQPKQTKRDTRYDKDFDNFFNYRYGDFSGEVDYDPKTDTDVESWRNVKRDIMRKNNWTDKEFEDRFKEYSDERYKKTGNDIIAASVETAKKHPVLGTIQQAVLNPGVWIEGAANMLSGLIPGTHKAQSAEDPLFLSSRQKDAIKQTVKDEHIKSGVGKAAYDIGTSVGDMAMSAGLPVLGTAALGTETASRTQRQALERDVDPTKAALTGLGAGTISGVLNKVGLDKAVNTTAKTALGGVLKAAGIEGAENVTEDTANLLIDTLMNKDKSQLNAMHDYYKSQGMTDDEAWNRVTLGTLGDLGISALSGAAFGGAMNGVRNIPELAGDVRALIPNIDNRGAVDPQALAEEARLNVKARAKVGLQGEELEQANTRRTELKSLIDAKKTEVQLKKEAYDSASKKNKNAAWQEYDSARNELNELKSEDKSLDRSIKGEPTPIKEQLTNDDRVSLFGNHVKGQKQVMGLTDHIGHAQKFAGDTPEAKQLAKEAKKSLNRFIESGDWADYDYMVAKAEELDNLAKNTDAEYNGVTYRDYFVDFDDDGNAVDDSLIGRIVSNQGLNNAYELNRSSMADTTSAPVEEGFNDRALTSEEVQKLQDVADGKYDIPETGNEVPNVKPAEPTPPEPPRRSFFDDLPRSDKEGKSKVGTNTAVNSKVYTRKQIDSDPIISELNKYAKANNDLTFNQAKEDIIKEGSTLLEDYTSGNRFITNDLDVDRAMILLTDMAQKIDAGDEDLIPQRDLLFSKLRQAGTLYGQTIQAFKKWNNTAEGAIINGERIIEDTVKPWKSQNKKKVELNARIAKAFEQMGVDSSMRNKPQAEKTHEQIKQGVKNVLDREFGSIEQFFNDTDIEYLTRLAEEKSVPTWKITDEIEHKLATGEWYSLDESTQPKYPINQRLKNALDDLVEKGPAPEKEPPTLDEIRNEVKATLDKEMARTGDFTDDDVNYLAGLIQNGATKQELSEALNTKMATGKFGISPETQQQVTDLFAYANRFDPDSKQAFDLRTAAYKLLAEESVSDDATPFEKFESWRYLAMLGNPKTMVRNWIGNKMFSAVTGVSNNLSAALEAGTDRLSKALGGEGIQRTKTFLNPVDDRALIKAAGEDGEAHKYTELSGSKYEKGTKDAIRQQKSAFNSKLLRLYEAVTDRGISDYSAVKRKYSTSLAGYMKANGLDESAFDADDRYRALKDKSRTQLLTDAERSEMDSLKSTVDSLEKARDYAVKQAEYATFHEDNAVAQWLTKTSNSAPGPLRMVLEGLVPFKKTPANILRSGFEYSPLGAIKSIKETGKLIYENTGSRKGNLEDTYTKKNKLTGKEKEVNKSLAADVLDSWSKTLTGTALVGLGFYLKNKGILNSSNKDEKWQDDLEGIQNYSITINGKTYTLDWAAPAVMPLLMGAEMSKIKDRNSLLDQKWYENLSEIIGTANAILDPIFETSMMQGVKNTLEQAANDIKYNEDNAIGGIIGSMALNTGLGYLTQALPTLSGQVARTVDNTRRTTDTASDGAMGVLEKQGRKIMNKIPGLSMLNQPYYDSYGRTQNNGPFNNPLGNMAYQMLSPAYVRDINTTAADTSARKAYYGLGEDGKPMMDAKVFPSWKSKVTVGGEKFTPEEMASYRKTSGEAQYAIRDALTKEEWFNNLDASQQTELLKKVNTLVDKIGKDSVDKLDSSSKEFEAYQAGGVEGLINKWSGDIYSDKAKEETGLSGSTNAIKEINQAYADGDTKKAEELTEKYTKYNKERERLNEKYGVNIKMADFTKREDANPGSNEEWAKEHSDGASTTTKTTTSVPEVSTKSESNTTSSIDTTEYQKQIDRAGKQSRKFTNDLPKLKELNYGKSQMYTYAYAINQDTSLTPQKFDTQFRSMDADKSGSLKQDELINYFNKNSTSEKDANYLWKTYGENKGTGWKTLPVLKNGTWKKSK